MIDNKQAKYYTPPGSYDGLVKHGKTWNRITELNRIYKGGWVRWQGPPTKAMAKALKSKHFIRADIAYPERENSYYIKFS